MSTADELRMWAEGVVPDSMYADPEHVLRRAIEALWKSEKTEAILRAVCSDLDLRACARCQRLHMHHHVCYHCGHDPSVRPSAAERSENG